MNNNNQPIDNSPGVAGFAGSRAPSPVARLQRGMALISGLLLLVVVTILAVSMFRSFGMQARIAGNTREKQRALHAAEGAQAYAEWFVSQPGGLNATMGAACTSVVTITQPSDAHVCTTMLDDNTVTTGPWTSQGKPVGFIYQPTGMSTTGADAYAQPPMFYIGFINAPPPVNGTQLSNYRIDATAAGGTSSTVAVVEGTYQVAVTYTTEKTLTKFYSLTGP
jgi:type IV pilus assembly protein PilX